MRQSTVGVLGATLLVYGVASLVHFVHNAEFLADYPNLPASWSRAEVYGAWLGLTGLGVAGWLALVRGVPALGFPLLGLYAVLGLDSLGHYVRAPFAAHTTAMNSTILLEVGAAALVLLELARLLARRITARR